MNTTEKVKTWRWRIKRVGHTQHSFCDTIQVSRTGMSLYVNGKQDPSLKMFDKIEGKLLELEEAADVEG